MSTAALPKILCHECQHENEAERVYCHECGAKLDRSAVIIKKEPPVDVRKRVHKMFDPTRARIRAGFFKTSKMILGAAVTGLIVVMFIPPNVPASAKTEMLASSVRIELEDALRKRVPGDIPLSQDQVNAYLGSALKTKKSALTKPFLDFDRAVVQMTEGKCTITTERSISGLYPIYTSIACGVKIANGKIDIEYKGGAIGCLQMHPKLMPYVSAIFADVRKAVDSDVKLLGRFNAIQIHDKQATLTIAAPQ